MVHERAERGTGLQAPRGQAFASPTGSGPTVNAHEYYGEYHGHLRHHLDVVHAELRAGGAAGMERPVVFLCGDSTLDNKYWLPGMATSRAINGYERALDPAVMQADVAFHVNKALVERGIGAACLNCSVEESTLQDRKGGNLLQQDEFIRDHLRPEDILVVSCGGNDIALRPTVATIASIAALMMCPRWLLESGMAPGTWHITSIFGAKTREFIKQLISACPGGGPRCVVVCMLYYLDEAPTQSWANGTLSALGYDKDPSKLQLLMRKAFELATRKMKLPGVEVVPLPLYEALDGKDAKDYVQRVEPSSAGGQKMAALLVDRIAGMFGGS